MWEYIIVIACGGVLAILLHQIIAFGNAGSLG
jgi:hypothetical protein